jgi:pentose-5-phosphate-3-epimerase
MILPSLLEYSVESLESKISRLEASQKLLYRLQETNRLGLHLDFVLPQFAKDRSVLTSLSLCDVFNTLNNQYSSSKLYLSIHLMGETTDLLDSYKYFESYEFNNHWNYLILISEKYTTLWRKLIKNKGKNIRIGCWYDLDEWQAKKYTQNRTNLIMTVKAGRSGQQLKEDIKQKALDLGKRYPQAHFILDGGWGIDAKSCKNQDIVSYSDFWKHL